MQYTCPQCGVQSDAPFEMDVCNGCSIRNRIRRLNDEFRRTGQGGQLFFTRGIDALPSWAQLSILQRVRTFDDFTEDNDPWREHDFGMFEFRLGSDTHSIMWKIDYYDREMKYGSPMPADTAVTTRVLTVLLSHEW